MARVEWMAVKRGFRRRALADRAIDVAATFFGAYTPRERPSNRHEPSIARDDSPVDKRARIRGPEPARSSDGPLVVKPMPGQTSQLT